jgi:hypothetical protein
VPIPEGSPCHPWAAEVLGTIIRQRCGRDGWVRRYSGSPSWGA